MPARPITYCRECGEYIAPDRDSRSGYRHIDADGATIHRAHVAELDDNSPQPLRPRLP